MKLAKLLKEIEAFAPLSLALDWDNVGLLVGDREREIKRVMISLDFTPNTLDEAINAGADLILSHHPIWLRGTKNLTDPTILRMIEHKIALIALHTNLDTALYSVNHALAAALDLQIIGSLSPESGYTRYLVSVVVPPEAAEAVREAAFAAGAGRIGNYDRCSNQIETKGSFRPLENALPFSGEALKDSHPDEYKLEFLADGFSLGSLMGAIKAVHPYEEPLIFHHPLSDQNPLFGLGLICRAKRPFQLRELALDCKQKLAVPSLRLWTAGLSDKAVIDKIAICGGAGSSVIRAAAAKADVLITGDLTYHWLLDSPIPLIDAGHFYTEYPVLEFLKGKMLGLGLEAATLHRQAHEFEIFSQYL